MKRLRPYFQRSFGMAGFLAGIFITPALHAGDLPSPPKWVPYEMKAINLYETGVNEESTDMAGAAKTLQQAHQDSTEAILYGGGSNPAVLHNDRLIDEAFQLAQMDAAKPPEHKPATEKTKGGGNDSVKPSVHYAQTSIRVR